MSIHDQTPDTSDTHDDLADRLIDQGLREIIGGQRPPDLSEVILRRAGQDRSLTPSRKEKAIVSESRKKRRRVTFIEIAVAVSVIGVLCTLLLPAQKAAREVARNNQHAPLNNQATATPGANSAPAVPTEAEKKQAYVKSMESVEESKVPLPEEAPLTYPTTKRWTRLEEHRKRLEQQAKSVDGEKVEKVYPVADLVLPIPNLEEKKGGQTSTSKTTTTAPQQAPTAPVPTGATPVNANREDADFNSLIDLIDETVKPEGYYDQSAPAAPADGQKLGRSVATTAQPTAARGVAGMGFGGGAGGQWGVHGAPHAGSEQSASEQSAAKLSLVPSATLAADFATDQDGNKYVLSRSGGRIHARSVTEPDEGLGPRQGGDKYNRIVENEFLEVADSPLSTFSIDVDTASYTNVRQFLLQENMLPPPDAVRIEELVNYFAYDYAPPADTTGTADAETKVLSAAPAGDKGDTEADDSNAANTAAPFAAHIEVAGCPWQADHRLVRVALKGREIDRRARPPSNLVFLLDVSGSMDEPNKLPLLKRAMQLLAEQLGENDRVAIVVYASSEGLVLPSTPGLQKEKIIAALEQLQAGGSTAGGAGIQLAYKIAQDNFIKGGVNRVILCTDGDFNVGVTSPAELERMAEEKAKQGTFLTVLGFGRGNLNDVMMEAVSNRGNGNYHYVDNMTEARKVLVEELSGTLVTIAKDVKIQVEFNPNRVAGYRLIGYENRVLAARDFNDDKKDAGEIGAGHQVTALYEVVPIVVSTNSEPSADVVPTADPSSGETSPSQTSAADAAAAASPPARGPAVDPLKYQSRSTTPAANSDELLTLKLRYKQPDGDTSTKLEFPVADSGNSFAQASEDFQFASAVAAFGMLLRDSKFAGSASLDGIREIAQSAVGEDSLGYRKEFLTIVDRAKAISGK